MAFFSFPVSTPAFDFTAGWEGGGLSSALPSAVNSTRRRVEQLAPFQYALHKDHINRGKGLSSSPPVQYLNFLGYVDVSYML